MYRLTADNAKIKVKPTTHTTLIRSPIRNNKHNKVVAPLAATKLSLGGFLRNKFTSNTIKTPIMKK